MSITSTPGAPNPYATGAAGQRRPTGRPPGKGQGSGGQTSGSQGSGGPGSGGQRPGAGGRRWRAMLHPLRRTTLRTRLVFAVVTLVAVLGVVISLVSALFLRSYLVGQLDSQVEYAAQRGYYAALSMINEPGRVSAGELLARVVKTPGLSAGTVVAVVSDQGAVNTVYLSPRDPSAPQQSISGNANATIAAIRPGGQPVDVDLGGTLGQFRMVAVQLPAGTLVIGLPLADVNATTAQLLTIILLVTAVAIAAAGGVGLVIVVLALRPLDRVAATATAVSRLPLDRGEVALGVRVPIGDTDSHTEVGRLGAAFNHMLGHVASALSARQASENKVRQFVADASHELRTPLASIRGYAELTRRAPEKLPADAVRALGRIEAEAERMTGLVEDLLLLARLDEGRELDREPVDMSRLVIDAVSDAHAAGRDHSWTMDLPPEPVWVLGDSPRLYEVIANLLTNARVHTPEGTKVATELAVERGSDSGFAVVSITDDGPGIPDDLLPTLFERFVRGDTSRSRHTGSTGLGLAIVRAVVEAQGGTVAVESEPGETRFTVRLPLYEESAGTEAEQEAPPASEDDTQYEHDSTASAEHDSAPSAEHDSTPTAEHDSTAAAGWA